jgi:hypothetical protein
VEEQTAHFIVYEAGSGDILAVHHLTALPGMRVPSNALVQKRVLACAAEALARSAAELRLLATSHAQTISPGMRVDPSTQQLPAAGPQRSGPRDAKRGGAPAGNVAVRLRSP